MLAGMLAQLRLMLVVHERVLSGRSKKLPQFFPTRHFLPSGRIRILRVSHSKQRDRLLVQRLLIVMLARHERLAVRPPRSVYCTPRAGANALTPGG